jgi:hypothetical protein
MSETALTPPNDTTPTAPSENMILDGDAPRLGSTPLAAPAPMGGAGTPVFDDSPTAPALPVVSPVLSDPSAPMQTGAEFATPTITDAPAPTDPVGTASPTIPAPTLPTAAPAAPAPAAPVAPEPTVPAAAPSPVFDDAAPSIPAPSLPTPAPAAPAASSDDTDATSAPDSGDAEHPMAHLMGGSTSKTTEASLRAAQLRAEKKAKAKKMKIYFAIGAVIVAAVVGPPLWSWFTNALDEVGTSTEQPAD